MRRRRKKNFIYIIICIIIIVLSSKNAMSVRAFNGITHMLRMMKNIDTISYRRIKLNDTFFDVYINHNEKFISIHGTVDSLEEMIKIEKHFKMKAPSDYHIASAIKIKYPSLPIE
ncbi:MAG: hypothetical protein ACMUIP_09805 [bacterium]